MTLKLGAHLPLADFGDQQPIGTADHCVDVLNRYAAAGAREVVLWPIRDPISQLERCASR